MERTNNGGDMQGKAFPAGGVEAVWLAAADDVADCRYDEQAACWTEIAMREGGRFVPYAVGEDEASYAQRLQGRYGLWYIRHEVSWVLPVANGEAAAVVEWLRKLDERGMVALVLLLSGEVVLVGRSVEFGAERPLRLAAAEIDTCTRYAEDPVVRVTLQANDVACSRPFAGNMENLV